MLRKIAIALSVTVFFAGCVSFNRIFVEDDEVLNVRRVIYKQAFQTDEMNEQTYWQDLTFLKEIHKDSITTYTLFDVVTLPFGSFELQDNVYIIVDKYIEKLPTEIIKSFQNQRVKENKEEILGADSVYHTIVTGYRFDNKQTFQMKHELSEELIRKILEAEKTVTFRYYVGPNKINSKIENRRLRKLKKWATE